MTYYPIKESLHKIKAMNLRGPSNKGSHRKCLFDFFYNQLERHIRELRTIKKDQLFIAGKENYPEISEHLIQWLEYHKEIKCKKLSEQKKLDEYKFCKYVCFRIVQVINHELNYYDDDLESDFCFYSDDVPPSSCDDLLEYFGLLKVVSQDYDLRRLYVESKHRGSNEPLRQFTRFLNDMSVSYKSILLANIKEDYLGVLDVFTLELAKNGVMDLIFRDSVSITKYRELKKSTSLSKLSKIRRIENVILTTCDDDRILISQVEAAFDPLWKVA
jgi:hypothetical protein